jgi:hypothetical protein
MRHMHLLWILPRTQRVSVSPMGRYGKRFGNNACTLDVTA